MRTPKSAVTPNVSDGSASGPMLKLRRSFLLLLALLGCDGSALGPFARFDLSISTDQPHYALSTDRPAYVTITNAANDAVYFPMDSYVMFERFERGAWRDLTPWFVIDGTGPSYPLAPGASQTDGLDLRYLAGRPGLYRFRYLVYADAQVQHLLPLMERVSAPFAVAP